MRKQAAASLVVCSLVACILAGAGAAPGPRRAPGVDLDGIKTTDLFGRFYLGAPGKGGYDGYYHTIDALRPLLESGEWRESVSGFFINVAGDLKGVRLSYFTTTPARVKKVVEGYISRRGLEHIKSPEGPTRTRVSGKYGGRELRFRRFLAAYTLIGLEVMERDLLYARRVFVTYRWQVSLARKPVRPHFENLFAMSPFFNSLSHEEKEEFREDMALWPEGSQVQWAHLFVNMVLGGDWIGGAWLKRYENKEPLSLPELNHLLKRCGMGFQIPRGWRP